MMPEEIADRIGARLPDMVVARGEVTAIVSPDDLLDTLVWLRDDPALQLGFCSSVTATDRPAADPRFWVVYELGSMTLHHRLRLKVGATGEDPSVPSITSVHPTADWHEREVFDFFGVRFDGHPALTRILLPDDWEGFPLRKDEELGGVDTRFHGAFHPPIDERTFP
jgi:NADH-quinone oxidoreductase subunit C